MVFGGCRHGSQAARRTEHVNTVHRFHTRLIRPLVKTAPNDSLPLQKRGTFGQRDGQLVGRLVKGSDYVGSNPMEEKLVVHPWNSLWDGDQIVVMG